MFVEVLLLMFAAVMLNAVCLHLLFRLQVRLQPNPLLVPFVILASAMFVEVLLLMFAAMM